MATVFISLFISLSLINLILYLINRKNIVLQSLLIPILLSFSVIIIITYLIIYYDRLILGQEYSFYAQISIIDIMTNSLTRNFLFGYVLAILIQIWLKHRKESLLLKSNAGRVRFLSRSDFYLSTITLLTFLLTVVIETPEVLRIINVSFDGSSVQVSLREQISERIIPPKSKLPDVVANPSPRATDSRIPKTINFSMSRISRDILYVCAVLNIPEDECSSGKNNKIIMNMRKYERGFKSTAFHFIECFQSLQYNIKSRHFTRGMIERYSLALKLMISERYSLNKKSTINKAQNKFIVHIANFHLEQVFSETSYIEQFEVNEPWDNKCTRAAQTSEKIMFGIKRILKIPEDKMLLPADEITEKVDFCEEALRSNYGANIHVLCETLEIGKGLPYASLLYAQIANLFGDQLDSVLTLNSWIDYTNKLVTNISEEQAKNDILVYITEFLRANYIIQLSVPNIIKLSGDTRSRSLIEILHEYRPEYVSAVARTPNNCDGYTPEIERLYSLYFVDLNNQLSLYSEIAAQGEEVLIDSPEALETKRQTQKFFERKDCLEAIIGAKWPGMVASIRLYAALLQDTQVMYELARLSQLSKRAPGRLGKNEQREIFDDLILAMDRALEHMDDAIRSIEGPSSVGCKDRKARHIGRETFYSYISEADTADDVCRTLRQRKERLQNYIEAHL